MIFFLWKVFVINLSLFNLDFSVRVQFLLKTDLSFDNHQIMNRVFIENWQWVFDCKKPPPRGNESVGWFQNEEPRGRVTPLKNNPQNWSILGVWRGVPLPPGSWFGIPPSKKPALGGVAYDQIGGGTEDRRISLFEVPLFLLNIKKSIHTNLSVGRECCHTCPTNFIWCCHFFWNIVFNPPKNDGTVTWPDYLVNRDDQKNEGPFGEKNCTEIEK